MTSVSQDWVVSLLVYQAEECVVSNVVDGWGVLTTTAWWLCFLQAWHVRWLPHTTDTLIMVSPARV